MENLSRSNFYNGTRGQLNAKVCQQARCAAALERCSCSVAFLQLVLMSSAGRVSIPPRTGKRRHSTVWANQSSEAIFCKDMGAGPCLGAETLHPLSPEQLQGLGAVAGCI